MRMMYYSVNDTGLCHLLNHHSHLFTRLKIFHHVYFLWKTNFFRFRSGKYVSKNAEKEVR